MMQVASSVAPMMMMMNSSVQQASLKSSTGSSSLTASGATHQQPLSNSQMLFTLASIYENLSKLHDRQTQGPEFVSKFHSSVVADIPLMDYMMRFHDYCRCTYTQFVLSFIFIDRIQQHPKIALNSLTAHRLILTSLMLATKFSEDRHYPNSFFARVGGIQTSELNSLELEFLFTTSFNLDVSSAEFAHYETAIVNHARWMQSHSTNQTGLPTHPCAAPSAAASSSSSSSSSCSSSSLLVSSTSHDSMSDSEDDSSRSSSCATSPHSCSSDCE